MTEVEAIIDAHRLTESRHEVLGAPDDPDVGTLLFFAVFDDVSYLKIDEEIDARLGDPRVAYAYSLVIDGEARCRWDRDPYKHPEMADHWHPTGAKTPRRPRTVSLADVIGEAWGLVCGTSGDPQLVIRVD